MNRPTPISDPGTEEQASLWAVRLECSDLSASDRAELDQWLAADPARRTVLSRYCSLSARLDRVVPELAAAGAFEAPERLRAERVGWSAWKVLGAGLVAAALTLSIVWYGRSSGRPEKIAAATGERRTFTLSDGSKVELNANTSIMVENGSRERRVHLDSGEAFFVVSKDKSRPFIVETPAGSVRVTGTRFNVLSESVSQLDVTVEEGTVQVRPGEGSDVSSPNPYILTAGDKLSVQPGGTRLQPLSSGEIEDALAWRNGQIVGVNMPLSEVLARFAHYHGVSIRVSAGAANSGIGGRYNLDDLDGFLTQLPQVISVRVKHEAGGSIAVSLLSEP